MSLVLNDFRVDPRIEALMRRDGWAGRRADDAWFNYFRPHPESQGMPFIELCSIEHARSENRRVRREDLRSLQGKPSAEFPPGDFDPCHGYLIGFTDYSDSAICVDLRPSAARIIYESVGPNEPIYATAFETIDDFVGFVVSQIGKTG